MNDSTRSKNNGQSAPRPQRSAILYTRVSSKDQLRGGFSIPAQRKLLPATSASKFTSSRRVSCSRTTRSRRSSSSTASRC